MDTLTRSQIIGHLQNEISMQLSYQQYIDSIISQIEKGNNNKAITKLLELESCLKISKVTLVDCIHLINK